MNRKGVPILLLGVFGSTTAHAASETAEAVWGIAFWVFIGYCSIVVVPQALRAFHYLLFSGGHKTGKESSVLKTDAS